MKKIIIILCLVVAWSAQRLSAQIRHLGENIDYKVEISGAMSHGEQSPFWFSSNRYGLGFIDDKGGYLRTGLSRNIAQDSLRTWKVGYGMDMVIPASMGSSFILQQLYIELQWKQLRMTLGQKEYPLEFKNSHLSVGGLTTGIHARPLPELRIETPDFVDIPGTKNWLAIKGLLSFGAYTDNKWQRRFNAGDIRYVYSANSLYHRKMISVRGGNSRVFPVTITGGLEMACQFGGEAWNLTYRGDDANKDQYDTYQDMGHGIKQFWHALIPGGKDANDGDYHNASGNHLGSWHLMTEYQGSKWKAKAYLEHFFEDHSQLFWQYGWKDMLYGCEISLPKNPITTTLLYEYLRTDDQTGSIYRDATPTMPEQISAIDDYYNHHVYGAWQHAGFSMGTPLILSPFYNNNHRIICNDNRIRAHHIGVMGNPCEQVKYRVLFTHEKSLGTYYSPHDDPKYGNFLLVECSYAPKKLNGLNLTLAYAQNRGKLLGKSEGVLLQIAFEGILNSTH